MRKGNLQSRKMGSGRGEWIGLVTTLTFALALVFVLVAIASADSNSGEFTTTSDFNSGEGISVSSVDDELKLDGTSKNFSSLWVAASGQGTVVRIDTRTGAVLGEYRTAPEGRATNPSRTTVDKNGNVWVGNRDEAETLPNGRRGSVAHVGLEENGQCQDRNGNGTIETSTGLGDVRPWPNGGGADTPGGVTTASDECIIHYVRTLGPQIRHVSVDRDNNVWVAGSAFALHNSNFYELLSPNGETLRSLGLGRYDCCYGGLVDKANRMWSSTVFGANVYRIGAGATELENKPIGDFTYGMGIDNDQNIWVANWTNCRVTKLNNADGSVIGRYSVGACWGRGGNGSRGVVITPVDNNVWVANSGTDTVSRLSNSGTLLTQIRVGALPTGLAVDTDGKIWVTNYEGSDVQRIDPETNEVDLTVPLRPNSYPYNYSDMTGSTLVGAPPTGSWSAVHDSETPGNEWAVNFHTSTPGDSSVSVTYSTSANGVDYGPQEPVQSGETLANKGRFIKLNVKLKRAANGESPVLYDITARTANEPPVADAGEDQVVPEGSNVTLDGSGSTDPDGDSLDYHWKRTFGEGPPALLSQSNVARPTYETVDDGSARFELNVADGRDDDADETEVTVQNVAPTVSAAEASGSRGGATVLAAKFTDPGALDTHDAVINWGDGSAPEPAALTQGAGWGTIVAAHRFTSSGSYVVTVTVTDDDEGSATTTTNVVISTPAAIWANSSTDASALDISGSRNTITGILHSNSNLKVAGSRNSVTGGTEYVGAMTVSGSNHTFSPAATRVGVKPRPVEFAIADYRPGGRAAIEAGSANYFNKSAECSANGVWSFNGSTLPAGVYYSPCPILLSGNSLTGKVTLVSEQTIKVSGSRVELTPFINGLLFLAGSSGSDAIHLSGAKSTYTGYGYTAGGQLHISGSDVSYSCGIIADRIRFSGSDMAIRGSDCTRPTGAVALTSLLPRAEVDLEADRLDAIPGDTIDYTVKLSNTGGSLVTSGLIGGENIGATGATVAGYAYELEYFRASDEQWVPLVGAAATIPGYQFREPPRVTSGVQLALAPMASAGVSYPATGDKALSTSVAAGSLAAWGYQASVQLSAEQVSMLYDETATPMLRNVVRLEFENPAADMRELYRFGPNFSAQLRAQSNSIRNAYVTLTLPSGEPLLVDSATTPELSEVTPGEVVSINRAYNVAPIAARANTETSSAYRERLTAADDQPLRASARGRAQSDFGPLFMTLARATSTRHIPIVGPDVSGPTAVNAGTPAVFGMSFENDGSAPASQIAGENALEGIGTAPVTGGPTILAPGAAGAGTSSVMVPSSTPESEIDNLGTATWKDANGNSYGPLEDETSVSIVPAPKLDAKKSVSLAIDADDSGDISPGDSLDYSVSIANTTAGTATNVTYDDTPDANSSVVPGSLQVTQGSITSGSAAGDTRIQVSAGTLLSTGVVAINYRTKLKNPMPENAFQVINQGIALSDQTAPTKTDDPSRGGSQDRTVAIVTPPSAMVTATKRDSLKADADNDGEASPGDTLSYVVTIKNSGGKPGTGVVFADAPANGLSLVGGSVTASNGTIVAGSDSGDSDIRVEIPTLQQGESSVVEFDAKVDEVLPAGAHAVANQGKIFSNERTPSGTDDPDTDVVGDPTETNVVVPLRASTEKTDSLAVDADSNGVASPGDTIEYTLKVKNENAVPLHATILTDSLGTGTTLVSGSVTTTLGAVSSGSEASDTTVEVALGTIEPGNDATVKFRARINSPLAAGIYSVSNQAFVRAVGLTPTPSDDPDASGLSDPTVTEVTRTSSNAPVLTLSQVSRLSVDADGVRGPSVGDTLTFDVKVTNSGTGSATDLLISGRPSSPLKLVPGSVQGPGSLEVLSGNGDNDFSAETKLPTLFAGSSVTFSYQAKIGAVTDPSITSITSYAYLQSAETGPANAASTHPLIRPPVQPPAISEVTPESGTTITAPTKIYAQIQAPTGQEIYQHCLLHQQKGTTAPVKIGCTDGAPPADGEIGTFDPTKLENGIYDVIVRAIASSGGVSDQRITVSVEGALKLGRYTTTYQDLSVPIHSLPIQVLRSYDSYDKQRGDFGIGWNLSIANFTAGSNGKLGSGGWAHKPSNCINLGYLGTSCLGKEYVRLSAHFVTVRWPDGRTETFDFAPNPGSDLYYDSTAAFKGRPGTTSTLEPAGDPTLTYYGDGNLYDADGLSIYDPKQFVLTAKNGNEYFIDTTTGLKSATDRQGNSLTVTPGGLISSTGKSVLFTRDGQNRITRVTGPSGEQINYAYNSAGDLSSVTDARANTITHTYDSSHNLLASKDPQNRPFRTVAYDDDGRMVSVTDGAGNTTEVDTQVGDRQQVVTSPSGDLTTITTRDERGNLTRLQDMGGSTTRTSTFEYDARDNQTKAVDPLGNVSTSSYDERSNLLSTTDAKGRTTHFEYDSNDLPVKITRPDGSVAQTITRDADGNPTQVDSGGGEVTNFTYDSLGRLVNSSDPLGRFVETEYDANGNAVEMRDPAGVALTTTYDASNRPVSTTNALGATTTSTYDAEGNVIQATDAKGHSTHSTYDFAGRLLTQTDQLGRVASNSYDASGRLTSMTDRNGDVTNLEYDENGAVTRISASDGTEMTTEYDAFGRQVASVNDHARIEQSFDLNNRVISISTSGVPGSAQPTTSATYAYDSVGNRLSETTSRGTSAFVYDARDRLTSITDPQIGSFNYSYDGKDRLSSIARPNGVTTSYARNIVGDLTDIFHVKGATTVDEAHYTYDGLGQISTMSNADGAHSYSYDATGQLTAVNHPGAQPDESFSYDAAGNRTSNGEIYDAANRLLLDNDFSYTYDNEGNLLSRTDRVLGAPTTFEWDASQRQRAVTKPNGERTEYRFDPRGRRIESSGPSGTDRFGFGLSSNPLFEYDSGGSIEAAYVFGFGSDKPLAMRRGGQNHFQLQDMLANVTSLTNASGAKVESYRYSAFGKQDSPVSALGNPFSFAGREWDQESSTYYNRARQFDPNSGRFTSEDPLPSSNGYPYAGNDPVSSRDPSGLFSLSELGAANSIRSELAGEQVGFGMNLLGVFGGDGVSAGDVALGAGVAVAGIYGVVRIARVIRSIRATTRVASKFSVDSLLARASVPDVPGGTTKAADSLNQHHGQHPNFPTPAGGNAAKNQMASEVLEEIMTASGGRVENVSTGGAKGGFRYIHPDGRGATFNADGDFVYFGRGYDQ